MLKEETKKIILSAQRNEITEYHIYNKLAAASKKEKNKNTLKEIAKDELRHLTSGRNTLIRRLNPTGLKYLNTILSRG